jgi:hypothetical protein
MPVTYEPISTSTLSSGASSITFSSIPSTYTDLKVVLVELSSNTATQRVRFNSDTGSNYSTVMLAGNAAGTTASGSNYSSSSGIITDWYAGGSSTSPAIKTLDIFSYTGGTFKTILINNNNDHSGSGTSEASVGMWRSTSAITSITLTRDGGTYNTGTTATLYGIKAA